MLRKIILATEDIHKVQEFSNLIKKEDLQFILPPSAAIPFPEETGNSFSENAALKTLHIFEKTGKPSLADDSGLEVEYLKGAPGIYSARYSKSGSSEDNIKKLLNKLSGIDTIKRKAKFTCCIAYNKGNGEKPSIFEGSIEGYITESPSGNSGFGYDPIFFIPKENLTFAEMPEAKKNLLSHRAIAFDKFLKQLRI